MTGSNFTNAYNIQFLGSNNRIIRSNFTYNYGSGVITAYGDNTTVDESYFRSNSRVANLMGENNLVNNSFFSDNSGGISAHNSVIENSQFIRNSQPITSNSNAITNCNFTENRGYTIEATSSNITNCNFNENRAWDGGGAIIAYSDNIIDGCNFTANTASKGGAVFLYDKNVIRNSNFTDNYVRPGSMEGLDDNGGGGAVFVYGSDNVIDNALFTNNTARSDYTYTSDMFNKTRVNQTHYRIDIFCNEPYLREFQILKFTDLVNNEYEVIYDANFTLSDDETYSYMTQYTDQRGNHKVPSKDNVTFVNLTFYYHAGNVPLLLFDYYCEGPEYWNGYSGFSDEVLRRYGYGGAVASVNCFNNTIFNSTFIDNSATKGGSVYNAAGDLTIRDTDFGNSSAQEGSIIYTSRTHEVTMWVTDPETGDGNYEQVNLEADTAVDIINTSFMMSQTPFRIDLILDKDNTRLTVKYDPGNSYINGIYSNNSAVNFNNVRTNDSGVISEDVPVYNATYLNENITVEIYGVNGELFSNTTYLTDDSGMFYLDVPDIYSDEHQIGYFKAYHPENKYYSYAEDELAPAIGDFEKLQYLVNKLDENGTLKLTRDYIYTLNLDTITEGVEIRKNNITIDGDGFSVDALAQFRIFKILGNGTRFTNITFKNATNSALHFENVSSAYVDNAKFHSNQGVNGTVYFTGENLTMSDVEFVNSTALHQRYNETYAYYYDSYNGTAVIYANATGVVSLRNANVTGSRFATYAINVIAPAFVLDGAEFTDNLALGLVYAYNETSDEAYLEQIYHGFDVVKESWGWDNALTSLVFANSTSVNITDVSFKNNTVLGMIYLESENATVRNIEAANSTAGWIFDAMIKSSADVNGIAIDNVSSLFYKYMWEPALGDYVYEARMKGEELINIINVIYHQDGSQPIIYDSNVTFENVDVKNILYHSPGVGVSAGSAVVNNISFTNIHPEEYYIYWDGEKYVEEHYPGAGEFLEVYCERTASVYNLKSDNCSACYYVSILGVNAGNNITLKNFTVTNLESGMEARLIGLDINGMENATIIVDNIYVDNARAGGYNETSSEGWMYEREGGNMILSLECSENVDVFLSNVLINNTDVGDEVFEVGGKNIEMVNITAVNINGIEISQLFEISAFGNLTMENILVDNLKMLSELSMYCNNGVIESYSEEMEDGSISSEIYAQGNVYMNNIVLTNLESVTT